MERNFDAAMWEIGGRLFAGDRISAEEYRILQEHPEYVPAYGESRDWFETL